MTDAWASDVGVGERRARETGRWCVCVSADERFALPLQMTLASLARHHGVGREVRVLADGLSPPTLRRLGDLAATAKWDFAVIEVDDAIRQLQAAGITQGSVLSPAALGRLVIADLVDPDYDRVVYLDSDVLVCGDLAPLVSTDLGDACVGAVAEAQRGSHLEDLARAGFDLDDRYFNSGVLLLDLVAWRRGSESRNLVDLADNLRDVAVYGDQDYLNVAFARRWYELPPEWNVQSRHFYPRRSRFSLRQSELDLGRLWKRRRVVHFNSPRRPWIRGADHPGRPAYLVAWARGPQRRLPGPDGEPLMSLVLDRATARSAIDAFVARWRPFRRSA